MKLFNIKACKEIGILKAAIKEAILDGEVKNNKKEALKYIIIKAKESKSKNNRMKKILEINLEHKDDIIREIEINPKKS